MNIFVFMVAFLQASKHWTMFDLSIGSEKFLKKDLCAIWFGLTLINVVDGEWIKEEQDTFLDKILLNSLIISMD